MSDQNSTLPDATIPNLPSLFKIDLGENGGEVNIRNLPEIIQWIDTEIAFWDFLKSQKHPISKNLINEIYQVKDSIIRSGVNPPVSQLAKQFSDLLQRVYLRRPHNLPELWYHSTSLKASFLKEVHTSKGSDANFDAVMGSVAYFRKEQINWSLPFAVDGYITAALFEMGFRPNATAMASSIEATIRKHNDEIKELNNSTTEAKAKWNDQVSTAKERAGQLIADIAGSSDKAKQNLAELKKLGDETIQNLQGLFMAHMALQAPSEYWRTRATRADRQFIEWGGASLVVIVLTTLAAFVLANTFLKTTHPSAALIVVSITILTLLIWVIRVLVKITLSHLNNGMDANERCVMVTTYLALLKEKHVEVADRHLMLQAIFRPGSHGLFKEDGGASVYQALSEVARIRTGT